MLESTMVGICLFAVVFSAICITVSSGDLSDTNPDSLQQQEITATPFPALV